MFMIKSTINIDAQHNIYHYIRFTVRTEVHVSVCNECVCFVAGVAGQRAGEERCDGG